MKRPAAAGLFSRYGSDLTCVCGPLVSQTSQPITETHDLLDHIWGWSQVGGALLATVALVIALISARDSKRSADAADKSAKAADRTAESTAEIAATAREELELVQQQMNRRPILRLQVDTIDGPVAWGRSPSSIGIQLGFSNDGDADAMDTIVNLVLPPGSSIWKWKSAGGEGEAHMVIHATGKEFEEFPSAIYAVDGSTSVETSPMWASTGSSFRRRARSRFA